MLMNKLVAGMRLLCLPLCVLGQAAQAAEAPHGVVGRFGRDDLQLHVCRHQHRDDRGKAADFSGKAGLFGGVHHGLHPHRVGQVEN